LHRVSRFIRAVLIPVAALTILVASAMPASASTLTDTASGLTAPVLEPLSINW
jgi:hypothetical protein